MNKKLAIAVMLAGAVFAGQPVAAQEGPADTPEIQKLRAGVKTDKRALVNSIVQPTPAEAKKFWPLYDAYQRSLDASNRQRARAVEGLVGRDKPLTDLYARDLVRDLIAADEEEVKARRALSNKVLKALEPKKAARYLQLESKLRAIQAYDIAVVIPLAS
jgi:hypothetical protein